jgi:hypothetical protein
LGRFFGNNLVIIAYISSDSKSNSNLNDMKKIVFSLLVFAVSLMANTYGQVNLTLNLKAHYPFYGNAVDVSGYNNHGIIIGTVTSTTDRFGNMYCAYEFPGTANDFIHVAHSADFDIAPTGALSISLWYQGGSVDPGDLEYLFQKYNYSITPITSAYHLGLYDGNNAVFGNNYSPVVIGFNSASPPPIPDTFWHHVVGIYNNGYWELWHDNTLVDTDNSTPTKLISQSIDSLVIGQYFDGKIDDIRFYDRAITPAEVDAIFNLPAECNVLEVDELEEPVSINIFPNPTKSFINIETTGNDQLTQVSVFDLKGQEIIKQSSFGQKVVIDLASYPNGLYFIRAISGDIIQTRLIQKLY